MKTYDNENALLVLPKRENEELEHMFEHSHGYEGWHFERLGSFGCPPSNFPLNRGDWFDTTIILRELATNRLLARKQTIYTGTEFPSKRPVWFEFKREHLIEAK